MTKKQVGGVVQFPRQKGGHTPQLPSRSCTREAPLAGAALVVSVIAFLLAVLALAGRRARSSVVCHCGAGPPLRQRACHHASSLNDKSR